MHDEQFESRARSIAQLFRYRNEASCTNTDGGKQNQNLDS